jgi:activator of HSP90 ATPase
MSFQLEAVFPVSPGRLYTLLTSTAEFAAATGTPASIEASAGAPFTLFGGNIEGRQIELVPGLRIVQAWRGRDWAPGLYSLVRFTLVPAGSGTRLTLHHTAYPEGPSPLYPSWREHLSANWPVFYFDPIARYLAAPVPPAEPQPAANVLS